MKIGVGSDHAGYRLKRLVHDRLIGMGHDVVDFGTDSEASCDYPDYAKTVATAVADGKLDQGILICGTGLGMAIAANKVKGIRAVTSNDIFTAELARAHNDANVLCMGARVVGDGLAEAIVSVFVETAFVGARHKTRLDKIARIEKG